MTPRRPPRVLVADDEQTLRDLLALNLEAAGFEVVVADDGQQALELVRRFPPDVVVLDVMMPNLDGLGVVQALRRDPRTRDTKIVMLSAKGTDEDVWAGWKAGADCYLTKPCSMGQLVDTITRVFVSSSLVRKS